MTVFGPKILNFDFVKGTVFLSETPAFVFIHKSTGTPVDLTGATVKMTLRDAENGALVGAFDESDMILGGNAGTLQPKILQPVTDLWTPPKIDYDLWIDGWDGGSDNEKCFLIGVISLIVGSSSTPL